MFHQLLIVLAIAVWTIPAAAQDLVSHRAVYSVTTHGVGERSGEAAGWIAIYELRLTCDGYDVNDIQKGLGQEWEGRSHGRQDRDGKVFQFDHRHLENGEESVSSKAKHCLIGMAGGPFFSNPHPGS